MRLADFLDAEREQILGAAAEFAKTLPTLAAASDEVLRDHFSQCLDVIASDLRTKQSRMESIAKSQGRGPRGSGATAAEDHGEARANSGLTSSQLLSEYRALRSSVLRLWMEKCQPSGDSLDDVMRFNEAIDQAVAESLIQYERQVEQWRHIFLGVIGHDLRTPLHAIGLTSDFLRLKAPTELKKQVDVLAKSIKRIGAMLDSLLNFSNSRIGSEMTLTLQKADLAKEIAEEVSIIRAAFPQAEITLDAGQAASGCFDVSRIREAVTNLVTNAIQHGTSRSVKVAVTNDEKNFHIKVRNDGHIPESKLAGIFQPMKSGGDYKTGHRTNLGLGLFICKQITSAHKGEIHVTSHHDVVEVILSFPIIQTEGSAC
jgi:signal transduction histidine kinase